MHRQYVLYREPICARILLYLYSICIRENKCFVNMYWEESQPALLCIMVFCIQLVKSNGLWICMVRKATLRCRWIFFLLCILYMNTLCILYMYCKGESRFGWILSQTINLLALAPNFFCPPYICWSAPSIPPMLKGLTSTSINADEQKGKFWGFLSGGESVRVMGGFVW